MLYSQCTQAPARDTGELAYVTLPKSTVHFKTDLCRINRFRDWLDGNRSLTHNFHKVTNDTVRPASRRNQEQTVAEPDGRTTKK